MPPDAEAALAARVESLSEEMSELRGEMSALRKEVVGMRADHRESRKADEALITQLVNALSKMDGRSVDLSKSKIDKLGGPLVAGIAGSVGTLIAALVAWLASRTGDGLP